MESKKLSLIPLAVFIVGVVAISLLFVYASPEAFIEYVGIKNGYLLMFALAFFSGVSLFTGAPYVLIMITLVAGGLNPFLLAFVATVGDTLGGTIAYFLGRLGRDLAPTGFVRTIQNYLLHISITRPWLLPIAIFAYGCAAPFSNDAVTIPMGITRYSFNRTMIPLQLGTFVYNIVIATGGMYLFTLIFG